MLEKSDTKWLSLATAPILGQPPRFKFGPRGVIRTLDPYNPIVVRYQAALHAVERY